MPAATEDHTGAQAAGPIQNGQQAAAATDGQPNTNAGPRRLKFAVICASNMNRSMSAHDALKKAGFQVSSFGVGAHVKLPGPSARQPNIYNFGTPYAAIHEDLSRKDPELYRRNGLLPMLERNMRVKKAPEKWQECRSQFDVVLTFEERVMDVTVEHLMATQRGGGACNLQPVLVINLDIKDSAEEAAIMAPQALRLCNMVEQAAASPEGLWGSGLEQLLDTFQQETGRTPLYTICWY